MNRASASEPRERSACRKEIMALRACLLATAFAACNAAAAPIFTSHYLEFELGEGESPTTIAVGDVNGDGRLDMAVPNLISVSLLLGRGGGTFAEPVDYPTPGNASVAAIADLNADGLGDVMVSGGGILSLFPGMPGGTLGTRTDVAIAGVAVSIAVADLDADGNPDVVLACDGNSVTVLLGNGAGGFRSRTDIAVANSGVPSSVAVGDINGDGKLDVAVSIFSIQLPNEVSILPGDGNGGFGARTDVAVGSGISALAMGDLNGDGKIDLALAASRFDSVSVAIGTGGLGFSTGPRYYVHRPGQIALSDLDGDSKLDLIATHLSDIGFGYGIDDALVLQGNGDGSFGAGADFVLGALATGMSVADVNSDGRVDLVVARQAFNAGDEGSAAVLLGNGDRTFGSAFDYPTGFEPQLAVVADVNADGRVDAVVANYDENATTTGTVSVLLGDGAGALLPRHDWPTGAGPVAIAAGDLDGDGDVDLAVTNSGPETVSLLWGEGDGTFPTRTDYPTAALPVAVEVGELNNDNRPDFIVGCVVPGSETGFMSVYLAHSGDPGYDRTDYTIYRVPFYFAIGDLDRDGNADVVGSNEVEGTVDSIAVFFGAGDGTFRSRQDYAVGDSPAEIAIGDVNADGVPDIAVANGFSSNISVLLGAGDGSFPTRIDSPAAYYSFGLAMRDLNGDGKLDLAVTSQLMNTVDILLGNGNGTFGARIGYGTGIFPITVKAADFDGDSDSDLLVVNGNSNSVTMLINTTPSGPTPVLMELFDAGWVGGVAELRWRLVPSERLALARLERSPSAVGPWTPVRGEPTIASGEATQQDPDATPLEAAFYRLVLDDGVEARSIYGPIELVSASATPSFTLAPIAPDPSPGGVTVDFTLDRQAVVRLDVFEVTGRSITSLANASFAPGHHRLTWNGHSGSGRAAPGIYFVRGEGAGAPVNRRFVLLR